MRHSRVIWPLTLFALGLIAMFGNGVVNSIANAIPSPQPENEALWRFVALLLATAVLAGLAAAAAIIVGLGLEVWRQVRPPHQK